MACLAGTVRDQSLDVRCHSTQRQLLQQASPDISRLELALQQQWDHAANAHLGPIDIKPYTRRKVWWTCDQCPDGHPHSWEASIDNRTSGTGCPQCVGRKVCKHNSLATKAPAVAAQWDYGANSNTPDHVMAQSNQPVGWLCDACCHTWTASPNRRVNKNKTGCPECAQNARRNKKKQPTFADCQDPHVQDVLIEWDHERNTPQGNFPHNIRLQSNKQIFWLCTKCPAGQEHSWLAMPSQRCSRAKSGCPFCAGKAACGCNSLQALFPGIAAEWDYAKNKGQPSDYTASSSHLAWWASPVHGNWQQSITTRTTSVQQMAARSRRIQQRLASANLP